IKSEHIEGGESRSDQRYIIYNGVVLVGCIQNFFFAKEACKWGNTRNSKTSNKKTYMSNGKKLSQSAHVFHFITMYIMNDCSSSKEEQCFEHCMCKQMEHGCRISQSLFTPITRYAQCKHHESNLRHRRICKHTFDISLCACNHCSK